jgi:hypothetical protein
VGHVTGKVAAALDQLKTFSIVDLSGGVC